MVVLEHKSKTFSYSVRTFDFGKQTRYFIYVYICCNYVNYQVAEKNNNPYPALSLNQAKKEIMKFLIYVLELPFFPILKSEGFDEPCTSGLSSHNFFGLS